MGPEKKEFIFVIAVITRKDSQSAKNITNGAQCSINVWNR